MFLTDARAAEALAILTAVFVIICAVTFPAAGLYKRKWKYASIPDYVVLVQAILIASLVLMTCVFFYSHFAIIPHSIIAIEILALVSLLAAVRLSFRQEDFRTLIAALRWAPAELNPRIPVLLVGAGHEADLYLRALQRDSTSTHEPVGFLNNSPDETGSIMRGVVVLGSTDEFDAVVAELDGRGQRPRHLIFTAPLSSFESGEAERLIACADRMGMAVSRLNPATELRNPRVATEFELRPIELTDLLERSQAALDVAAMQRFIGGRRVMITGAGGSIGSELARQVAGLAPSRLVLVDNSEFNLYSVDLDLAENFPAIERSVHLCDVRDRRRVEGVFAQHRPELIFHAAALKHVPMVELNPCEGVLTNVFGTMNIAEAVKRWGALGMVQISTDKVVNSPNVMGSTKRLAELYCQSLDLEGANDAASPRFMTVRFGNVLGSSGSLIPLFKRQLARGGPLTVTHPEMMRFFMTIREAVELTLQAALERDSSKHGTNGADIDFALLVDGLEAEREQGITIDVAYRFFAMPKRKFIVADTPGHEQYTRNMATGASTADLAIVLVDARRGILQQTRRHSIIASLLGIRHVALAVNKFDLVDFGREVFERISAEYRDFASGLNFQSIEPIPMSARYGDNVTRSSDEMRWYSGPTLLEHLEAIAIDGDAVEKPFRLPVQYVNRPNQDFRGFSGTIASGFVAAGQTLVAAKSGRRSRVKRILVGAADSPLAIAGQSVTLLLEDEIEISRGDVLSTVDARPEVG